MIDQEVDARTLLLAVGRRARQLRLIRGLAQQELAARAGVGVATVRRFERSGAAALESAMRIAIALRAEASFEKLFEAPAYRSLDEALARPPAARERAPRKARPA